MKRVFAVIISIFMVFALAACSGGGGGSDDSFTWTREGTFEDESGSVHLMIMKPEMEEYGDWYVGVFMDDGTMYGWYLSQEGETLHGDLLPNEVGEGDYIVTVSEEGEDGVQLVVEGGETYHFRLMSEEETKAKYIARINVEGLGEIAFAEEGEEPQFDDEFPFQSAYLGVKEETTYVVTTRPEEGWQFVKWTKDGEDFSTEPTITIVVNEEDTEYIAVYEFIEEQTQE